VWLIESAFVARRDSYEPKPEYRSVVRRQHLWRPSGCRGWRRSPGRRDPVPIHFLLSGLVSSTCVSVVLYAPRQLTKEQLISVLPPLLNRLESQKVVVYTYAAVALDRILSMRAGGSTTLMCACSSFPLPSPCHQICRFSSADVQPFASQLLDVLLA
jgi:hypothetical protein